MTDYYEVLGVAKTATPDEIKRAYRQKAHKHHPDKHSENKKYNEEKFKEVKTAFEVLSDPSKRANYDQFGTAEPQPQHFHPGFTSADFSDLFSQVFGDHFRQTTQNQKKRLQIKIDLDLEQLIRGASFNIDLKSTEKCADCNGTGSASKKTTKQMCPVCRGSGREKTSFGPGMHVEKSCHNCKGSGSITTDPCRACHGAGVRPASQRIQIEVPAGQIENSMVVSINENQELYVQLSLRRHSRFELEGLNLKTEILIPLESAVLGGEISINNIYRDVSMTIHPGTQSGSVFKLAGQGFKARNGRTGDLFVRVSVDIPTHLSEKSTSAFKEAFSTLKNS